MSDDALNEGVILSGTYRIVRLIGRGGMGEVYEALHQRTGASFAIKILAGAPVGDDAIMERFRREAEVTSRLKHPNIVKVFDFDRLLDGRPFLAMELLSGMDLAVLAAAQRSPMSVARISSIIDQISLALFAAHEAGVVHRDLKPGNVFIEALPGSNRDLVRVLDFGISKLRNAPGSLTRTAAVIGTPHYMSPEQATGQTKNIDGQSDQFSLATIAYELLTGRRAFAAESGDGDDAAMAIIFRVVHQAPPSWTSLGLALPESLERIVLRGMAKVPAERFPHIRAFGEAFIEAASQASLTAESAIGSIPQPPGPMSATLVFPQERPAIGNTTLALAAGQSGALEVDPAHPPISPASHSRLILALALAAGAFAAGVVGVIRFRPRRVDPTSGHRMTTPELRLKATVNRPVTPPPIAAGPGQSRNAIEELPRPAPLLQVVTINIDRPPKGLIIIEGDNVLALPLQLPKDGRVHHLLFKAAGRRDVTLDIVGEAGQRVSLREMGQAHPNPVLGPVPRPRPLRATPSRTRNEDIL
jgi:serine/threonine-protein kinase